MPVHNRESLVIRAMESILSQNFSDFELIVVDDGSTDGTWDAICAFRDARIRTVRLPENRGNAAARNAGIELSRGEFIATMDSDDVSLPDRLGKQRDYLHANPRIDLLGTNIVKYSSNAAERQAHPPQDSIIKARLLLLNGSAMIHPTTMMRKSFLDKHCLRYPDVPTDVDHALWIDAMAVGGRFSVLQDYLVEYYRHGGNLVTLTGAEFAGHEKRKTPMRARVLALFYPALSNEEAMSIARLMEHGRANSRNEVGSAIAAIQKAQNDMTSHLGESKPVLLQILRQKKAAAEMALQQAGRRRAAGKTHSHR